MNINIIFIGITVAAFSAYFAYRTIIKKRRIDAADKFHSIITNTLKDLYSVSGDIKWRSDNDFVVEKILTKYYPVLSAAVTDYSSVVKNKQAFLNDWDIYRGKDIDGLKADQNYMQYSGAQFNDLPKESREVIFHNNVTNLLKHAQT